MHPRSALAVLVLAAPLAAQSNLLFASEFESGVVLEPPYIASSQWFQHLDGADLTGFEWPEGLPNVQSNFQYQVGTLNAPTAVELATYVDNRLETVIGPYGSPTTALYQVVYRDDPDFVGTTRSNYHVYEDGSGILDRAYCRMWIKLQADLEAHMPPYGWRVVAEWMERVNPTPPYGIDYRVTLLVNTRQSHPTPYWSLFAEHVLPAPRVMEWTEENYAVPVPSGEWFELEMFWNRSTGSDGRWWIAVNGQVLFDHRGKNMKDGVLKSFLPFKCYTGTSSLAVGPANQWVDGFELWDGFPPARRYGCGVNPPGSLSVLSGEPILGTTMTLGVHDPSGTQEPGSTALLLLGLLPSDTYPCGPLVTGLGMAGSGAPGEFLLRPPGLLPVWIGPKWNSAPVPFPLAVPANPLFVNLPVRAQGALWNSTPGAVVPLGLTDALTMVLR